MKEQMKNKQYFRIKENMSSPNDAMYQQENVKIQPINDGNPMPPPPPNNNYNPNYGDPAGYNPNWNNGGNPNPYNPNNPNPNWNNTNPNPGAPYIIVDDKTPICPICRQHASQVAIQETSIVQWLWCFGIFLIFWPVCCIPFCMRQCDDIRYECSNCHAMRSYYNAPCCPCNGRH